MKTKTTQFLIREKLEFIIQNDPRTIRAQVAQEAIDYGSESITVFFNDLFRYGCISGMITSLIYYVDTHNFYNMYYNEIEELREIHETSIGEPLNIEGDLKNFMAWFAFEETAYQLANELGLEI